MFLDLDRFMVMAEALTREEVDHKVIEQLCCRARKDIVFALRC